MTHEAFETAMRANRVALSPLLIKKQGLLRARVEKWCADLRQSLAASRKELNIEIPSPAEHESLPFALLAQQRDKLISLGLSNEREIDLDRWLSEDIGVLMTAIDGELTRREDEALAGFIEQCACRVAEDEPNPRWNELRTIIEQRHDRAGRAVIRSKRNAKDDAAEVLKGLQQDDASYRSSRLALLGELTASGAAPGSVRRSKRYLARIGAWKDKGTAMLPDSIELLIDETILLLRYELLKDVTTAAEDPQLSTWGAGRARSIREQAEELNQVFASAKPGGDGDGFRRTYAQAAFSRGRSSIIEGWLPA